MLTALILAAMSSTRLLGGGPDSLLVDAFDGGPKIGGSWEVYKDDNNLGTKVNPFAVEKDGNPTGSKGHGRFSGHIGKNMAPFPWAVLDLSWQDAGTKDLSEYKALRFWAKGDGKKHRARIGRAAVEDFCYPEAPFVAPKEWTRVTLALSDFRQPDWGKQVAAGFKDVKMVGFAALSPGDDEDFELRLAAIEFVKELPAKSK
jgi:hypothetical protein